MSTERSRSHTLEVREGEEGRLDRFVAERMGLSRTRVQALLDAGHVTVDGRPARKSEPVARGMRIAVQVPPDEPVDIQPEPLPLEVVYEDEDLLVLVKSAGMVVHPAPGHRSGTLVNALLARPGSLSSVGGRARPGIVHRLDRDTSGLMVVAKTDRAHHALSDALRARRMRRIYVAACWGHLPESPLTIDAPIARDRRDRRRMAVAEGGRRALTRVRVRERWERADLLDVALETGRTHQIRVHLAHVGHPVVGDPLYGAGWERGMGGPTRAWALELARRTPRLFLHASELALDHPVTGERMRFRAPLPDDLAEVAAWARGGEKGA
ncbi:MAG TPA: RluA family pseudouridine synthase [Longimicrobiales bacterium]|nr:RluA family pseudouridine synthase [Longimicrobiales bacterium]